MTYNKVQSKLADFEAQTGYKLGVVLKGPFRYDFSNTDESILYDLNYDGVFIIKATNPKNKPAKYSARFRSRDDNRINRGLVVSNALKSNIISSAELYGNLYGSVAWDAILETIKDIPATTSRAAARRAQLGFSTSNTTSFVLSPATVTSVNDIMEEVGRCINIWKSIRQNYAIPENIFATNMVAAWEVEPQTVDMYDGLQRSFSQLRSLSYVGQPIALDGDGLIKLEQLRSVQLFDTDVGGGDVRNYLHAVSHDKGNLFDEVADLLAFLGDYGTNQDAVYIKEFMIDMFPDLDKKLSYRYVYQLKNNYKYYMSAGILAVGVELSQPTFLLQVKRQGAKRVLFSGELKCNSGTMGVGVGASATPVAGGICWSGGDRSEGWAEAVGGYYPNWVLSGATIDQLDLGSAAINLPSSSREFTSISAMQFNLGRERLEFPSFAALNLSVCVQANVSIGADLIKVTQASCEYKVKSNNSISIALDRELYPYLDKGTDEIAIVEYGIGHNAGTSAATVTSKVSGILSTLVAGNAIPELSVKLRSVAAGTWSNSNSPFTMNSPPVNASESDRRYFERVRVSLPFRSALSSSLVTQSVTNGGSSSSPLSRSKYTRTAKRYSLRPSYDSITKVYVLPY